MPKIIFEVIPHKDQRYETYGDYYEDADGAWHIRASDMGNSKYEFLVLLHEFVEWFLTQQRGIPEPYIKVFDEAFEAKREPGNIDEPGDSRWAPYYREHQFATAIERLVATELDVDWNDYENAFD